MPLLQRVRVLAASIEATSGTAETLDATDAVFNAMNISIQPNIEFIERPGQSAFSPLPGVTGLRGGTCTFTTELFGDGAAGVPTWADTLLPCCGWVKSIATFSPKSEAPGSNVKTATIAVYENGLKKFLRGASGTFKIMLESGKPIRIEWTFTGAYQTEADATILAPTYPTIKPLKFSGATFTIGGATPACMASIELDAGNTVVMRECPTASDGSGYAGGIITGRKVVGKMNPETVLIATNDVYGKWVGHTEEALSIAVTDGTDTVTIAAPKIQRTNKQEGDRNGVLIDDVDFQCNRSASAGDDELTINFA